MTTQQTPSFRASPMEIQQKIKDLFKALGHERLYTLYFGELDEHRGGTKNMPHANPRKRRKKKKAKKGKVRK